jgi:hypothetical protein
MESFVVRTWEDWYHYTTSQSAWTVHDMGRYTRIGDIVIVIEERKEEPKGTIAFLNRSIEFFPCLTPEDVGERT